MVGLYKTKKAKGYLLSYEDDMGLSALMIPVKPKFRGSWRRVVRLSVEQEASYILP